MGEIKEYTTVGRRKQSVAKVRLLPGDGKIIINARDFNDYFTRDTDRLIIKQPLEATNSLKKYDIYASVCSGGLTGQAGAVRLGISRALVLADINLKETLRKAGFLTRDPRMKERKKYGRKGARKRFQWTKR